MQVHDQVEVTCTDLNQDGHGVARAPEGVVLFVPGLLPGEQATVRVTYIGRTRAGAEVVSRTVTSPHRAEPPCPVYDRCGGCSLQHMDPEGQMAFKKNRVEQALARIGGIAIGGPDGARIHDTLPAPDAWRYRNKGQFPVCGSRSRPQIGFYAPRSHQLVDMDDCLLQQPVADILACARTLNLEPYHEKQHTGALRHILIRHGDNGTRYVTLVTNGPAEIPPEAVQKLMDLPGMTGVAQNINPRRGNAILGPETRVLAGRDRLPCTLAGLPFEVSPTAFLQVNPAQAERLYALAVQAVLAGADNPAVLELYCGIGTMSLMLAAQGAHVHGVELSPAAIADANTAAQQAGLSDRVQFTCADAADFMREHPPTPPPDSVLLDPPRAGCQRAVLDALLALSPPRIVYVSCDPATLARDAAILTAGGYRVEDVYPVDMFPQTTHVECVVVMTRTAC